ncbi:hypothetical protein PIB30_044148 [Stylosanthes scabra]|uniref:Uncharacterized protein n=1 Tax=Stylosanthes scabra TaxID=79078 RepID=A0ABU6VFA1_9FABA|nr:hypothetical protein [Stylosanthes scabra]
MANQDEEGVVYTDHSGDDQRRDQQQQTLDLNATSTFDRIGESGSNPQPFGKIGSDESQIAQELRHCMQAMELEVRELRKENAKLRSTTRNRQPRRRTPPRRRSRSKSRSPPRRTQRPQTPPRKRRHNSSSDDSEFSSGRDRNGRRRAYGRYKRTRDWTTTPPIDGHTPFSSRILKVQPPSISSNQLI